MCSSDLGYSSFYGYFIIDNGSTTHSSWQSPMSWGTTNQVVFENCTFTATTPVAGKAAIDGYGGARYTMRYCNLTNYIIGCHGIASGANDSTLQIECYNNNFCDNNNGFQLSWIYWERGGTAVIYSNVVSSTYSTLSEGFRFSVECEIGRASCRERVSSPV